MFDLDPMTFVLKLDLPMTFVLKLDLDMIDMYLYTQSEMRCLSDSKIIA